MRGASQSGSLGKVLWQPVPPTVVLTKSQQIHGCRGKRTVALAKLTSPPTVCLMKPMMRRPRTLQL